MPRFCPRSLLRPGSLAFRLFAVALACGLFASHAGTRQATSPKPANHHLVLVLGISGG